MKTKIITTIALVGTLLFSVTMAQAERGVDGLLLGAGSGALIGQAIGRDTEATLLGTAVGGVLGFIIGNEMDKGGYPIRQPAQVSYRPVYRERVEQHHGWQPPPRYRGRPHATVERHYAAPPAQCREAEVLGTINGRPEKLYSTVCLDEYGRWAVMDDDRHVVVEKIIVYKQKNVPPGHRRQVSSLYNRTNW